MQTVTEEKMDMEYVKMVDKKELFEYLSSITPNIFQDTMDFQVKYGLWDKDVKGFLPDDKMKVKIGHLVEELNESLEAYKNKDLNGFADGLLDLIYVASGTLNLMNLPAKELWNDIQIRNMSKVRATADTVGKRGSTFDVVKPKGWSGPRTSEIIEESYVR